MDDNFYNDFKEWDKLRKKKNLANAEKKSDGWTKHTEFHWSRTVAGKRLDYWPSRNKFMYDGRVMCGGIEGFIKNMEKKNDQT